MAGAVAPVEEQEVLVDQVPLLEQDANIAGPHRRLALKALAAATVGALVGAALVTTRHQASKGSSWAKAITLDAMWQAQWHDGGSQWREEGTYNQQHQYHDHWHHHEEHHHEEHGDKVSCGASGNEQCTCEWASAQQCSRRDSPGTKCWSCCCREKFPDSYRWAMGHHSHENHGGWEPTTPWPSYEHEHPDHGYPDHGQPGHGNQYPSHKEYHRGDTVNVQSGHGHWHPATILNHVSGGRYQVQYDVSRRVEVVDSSQMLDAVWTPWWVWVAWVLLVACIIMCVVGLLGFLIRGKRGRREEPLEEQPIFRDDSNDRTCGRVCS